jgi:hypothetical protein
VTTSRGRISTPEQAALAGWPPEANAWVVRVESTGPDTADVIVETDPAHQIRVHTERIEGRWCECGEIVE